MASRKYPRLSQPVSAMRPEYDVVVIGSGYGGGVAASRMARAGKSVAVLELGGERWPGEYPRTWFDALRQFHISGSTSRLGTIAKALSFGNPTSMFNLILGEGQHALVARGLGGCSLINANVYLEADPQTLQMSEWPKEIRENPDSLAQYFERGSNMLQPTPYPEDHPPVKKLEVFEKQAKLMGLEQNFYRVPLTTSFRRGRNSTGVELQAASGNGQETTGMNDGSKNSVLMNYIPDAWNWGAEIFCECEVRYIEEDPSGSGYIIYFAWHGGGRPHFTNNFYQDLLWVRAREFCFLGAGAIGTTEILLRSRDNGLKMSRLVGHRISGNGDMFAFGYRSKEVVNGMGTEHIQDGKAPGPTITGIIDNRPSDTSKNVLHGYVIQEGCIPEAFSPIIRLLIGPNKLAAVRKSISTQAMNALLPSKRDKTARRGSINHTQTYLVMSHDNCGGVMTLKNDKPVIRFQGAGSGEHTNTVQAVLEKATRAIGGIFTRPIFPALGKEELTVHPLGGAIMSRDGTGGGGVTNHIGQVFSGDGSEVYKGLVCSDASAIPTSLGVNPLATITALAERSVDLVVQQQGLSIDLETRNGKLDLFSRPQKTNMNGDTQSRYLDTTKKSTGFRFTEIMNGFVAVGSNIDDFAVAEKRAKGASSRAQIYLSIEVHDVSGGFVKPLRTTAVTGTFSCAALSRDPLIITSGEVTFFSRDMSISDGVNLVYKLNLQTTHGHNYIFHGKKVVDSSVSFSVSQMWSATTTLFTTITRPDGSQVAKGKLYISAKNFLSQMKTMRPIGSLSFLSLSFILTFLLIFAYNLFKFFLRPFGTLEYPKKLSGKGWYPKSAADSTVKIKAQDGVDLLMRVYKPRGSESEEKLRRCPILFLPGLTMDHVFYALPTIPVNAVEYVTNRGHTAYMLTPRWGRGPNAKLGYTVFDSRLDVLAALEYIYAKENQRVYIVGHCQGSVAAACGLLDGTIPRSLILGMSSSAVFMSACFGYWNALKGKTTLLIQIYQILAGNLFAVATSPSDPLIQRILDSIMRFYPVDSRKELCTSTACHRMSFCFGRAWNHENIDAATHDMIHEFMGEIHVNVLKHVTKMGTMNSPLDNEYNSLLTDENLERLRGLPILFLSGSDNVVYDPVSTLKDYELLRRRFGESLYQRYVYQGRGQLDGWIGKDAKETLFWRIGEHLDWCSARKGRANGSHQVLNGA